MSRWEGFDEAVAVADTGSFTGAARKLDASTSHVSRAVARLEHNVGAQLFVRTTRAVALTDTGRVLIDQLRRIIAERDEALAMLDLQGEPQGELRITCSVALGERFVAPIVREYAQAYPRLSINLDLTNHIVDLVSEGYDLALRTGTLADSRLVRTQIAARRISLCASPAYLAKRGWPLTVEDLAEHDCIQGTADAWHFVVDGETRSFRPRPRWRCNSGSAVTEAALAGMGVCQLPEFYVADHLRDGSLAALLKSFRHEDEPVWAVYPQRRHLLPKVRLLIDKLRLELGTSFSHAVFSALGATESAS